MAKIATGRLGGWRERRHARQVCQKQIQGAQLAQIGLTINDQADRHCLFFPDMQPGALVVGSPGTGKTFGTINPLLRSAMRQGHGVILLDWKYPAQAAELIPFAAYHGYQVDVVAPGYAETQVFNPLDLMDGDDDLIMASEIAKTLARNFNEKEKGEEFFRKAGVQLLEGGILLAKGTKFPDLLMVQAILSLPNLAARLYVAQLPPTTKGAVAEFIAAAGSAKTAAGVLSGTLQVLNQVIKGDYAQAFCGNSSIELNLGARRLLVLGIDRVRSQICGPLVAMMMHLIAQHNLSSERAVPLVLGLDELATIVIPIEDWLNRYRSSGLCAVIGIQNIAQLEKIYGKEVTQAIVAGCPTKFIYNPGELNSAKVFSEYFGEQEVEFKSRSRGASGGKFSRNRSDQKRTKRVIEVHQLLKQRRGQCVIVTPGYASQRQAFIPIQQRIRVSKPEVRLGEWAQEVWQGFTKDRLIEAAPQREAELGVRQLLAERLFPLPKKKKEAA